MDGFFDKKDAQLESIKAGKKLSCYSCGLYRGDINYPKMRPTGVFKKKILNIGEFTNSSDDEIGKQFQGREKSLYTAFKELGIDLENDCLNINAVMCHPKEDGKHRQPNKHEIDCCRINILRIIEEYKPKVIILHGKIAITSVLENTWNGTIDSWEKWRGFVIPDQKYKCWIAPVYNASYIKFTNKNEIKLIWMQDLKRAVDALSFEFPIFKEPKITFIKDLGILKTIPNHSITAFDYETTGLKPHDKGHRIVCASIAINENEAYSFMMPNKAEQRKPFIDYLKNTYIKKMAHNLKFEETWSFVKLKTRVRNWFWDSMLSAHVIDNRRGITGLKFQSYVLFGIVYDEDIKKWLQSTDPKNANSKNKLQEFVKTKEGEKATLKYCGWDSVLEYRLSTIQQEFMNNILPF